MCRQFSFRIHNDLIVIGKQERKSESMKSKSRLTIAAVLVVLLSVSACGGKAVPTVDQSQVQASAVAAASTMVAETQAAMPTETPILPTDTPTDTPLPTPTLPPLQTNPVLPSPSATVVTVKPGGGECSGVITVSKGEPLANIIINNKTNVLLQVSLFLSKNSWGDCGYWSSPAGISANSSMTVTSLPAVNSCYHVTAFTLAGKPNFTNFASFCVGSSSATYRINVTTTSINIQ
jgi:hypothetical protein